MSTEELKIIMDALVQLGDAGKSGFIWWLVMKYGLNYLTIFSFIVVGAITVRYVVARLSANTHGNQLGIELSNLLGVAKPGDRWDFDCDRAQIKSAILVKVRELMEKERK